MGRMPCGRARLGGICQNGAAGHATRGPIGQPFNRLRAGHCLRDRKEQLEPRAAEISRSVAEIAAVRVRSRGSNCQTESGSTGDGLSCLVQSAEATQCHCSIGFGDPGTVVVDLHDDVVRLGPMAAVRSTPYGTPDPQTLNRECKLRKAASS
jgi:hypothetical protein